MRTAVVEIENGLVINLVDVPENIPAEHQLADETYRPLAAEDGTIFVPSDTASIGWLWDGKVLCPPPSVILSTERLIENIRAFRSPLLEETDVIALRCIKAGVPFPSDWQNYTQALRDITKQADLQNVRWPSKPVMPVGRI